MKAHKIIAICLFVILAFGSTAACGSSTLSAKDSAAGQIIRNAEKPLDKILQSIEKGEYATAEDLYQSDIIGKIQTEQTASQTIPAYTEALIDDYSAGLLSYEDINLILNTLQQTSMWALVYGDYLWSEVDLLYQSKQNYQSALEAREQGLYPEAMNYFSKVYERDAFYQDAVIARIDIAMEAAESNDLATLQEVTHTILDSLYLPEEILSQLSPEAIEFCTNSSDLHIRYGKALEENGYLYHAIQQYALCGYSPTDGSNLLLWENKWNGKPYSWDKFDRAWHDRSHYQLADDGIVSCIGNTGWNYSGVATQLKPSYEGYIASISPTYSSRILFDSSYSGSMYESFANRFSGFTVTQIIEVGDQIALLRANGTVEIGLLDPLDHYDGDIEQISSWSNMVYVEAFDRGYFGLTEDGRILCTTRFSDHAPIINTWDNLVSISYGKANVDPYYYEFFFLGLQPDGTILTSIPLPDGSYSINANAKAIKGLFYITKDGKLKSIFDEYTTYLEENYSDYSFSRITSCIYDNSAVIAESEDGSYLFIETDWPSEIASRWL